MQADPTTVGTVPPGTVLKLYDDHGREVPTGETGRIFLHNETALRGYTNPATQMVEIDGLIEMGDLGYFDADGMLHVQSRTDDMIIVGGENVHPQSVVEVLDDMPGVAEVAVAALDVGDGVSIVCAWVVPTPDVTDRDAVRDKVVERAAERLAVYKRPREVRFAEALPRTANGKVVRRDLG